MTFSRPRSGIFAVVGGRQYAAESYPGNGVVILVSDEPDNPDPALFERDESNGLWRAEVLTEDCERLAEVSTRARHGAHECQVVAIEPDGSTGLYYLGPDKSKAARDGFVQIESGVWAKTVDIHEVEDFREHHADLLFNDWLATLG